MFRSIIILILLSASILFGRLHIVLFDCSGSFIGPTAPPILKESALEKLSQLIKIASYKDTIVFIPIRENSTVSSLRQVRFIKEEAQRTYDNAVDIRNQRLLKEFAKKVMTEVGRKPAEKTDIVSAVNYASSIARLSKEANIWIFSDGDDNVKGKMFLSLKGLKIFHLFIFSPNSKKIQSIIEKWKSLYSNLGVKSMTVLDAQTSINYDVRF